MGRIIRDVDGTWQDVDETWRGRVGCYRYSILHTA